MNTLFLIVTDANGGVAKVTTHENRRDAFTYVNQMCLDRGSYHVVGEAHDLPTEGALVSALAAHLRAAPDRRDRTALYSLLASRYQSQAHEVIAPPRVIGTNRAAERHDMETQVAATARAERGAVKAAAKPATAAKAAKAKAVRGKPAGKVADFIPVKDGSKRASILKLMTGTLSNAEIGAALGMSPALVGSHVFCLNRDCAIGYAYDAAGKVTASYPAGKTLADALRDPQATAKRVPETAKAKAAKAATAAKKAAPAKKAQAKGAVAAGAVA